MEAGRHTTRTKEGCPIDVSGLKTFIESETAQTPRRDQQGRDTGRTLGETATDLLQRLSETQNTDISTTDETFIRKAWRYSEIGERLWASGHLISQREYASTLDPFLGWGKHVRWAAHARFGVDLDCRQSYPTAGLHMIPEGREACEDYVLHKDEIHEGLGWQWWGDMVRSDVRKDRVKALFNRLENEGSLHGHYMQFGIP